MLTIHVEPPGGKAMTSRSTVTVVDSDATFEWLGRLGIPGIFDGRHRCSLTPTPSGGTHLVHGERCSGGLVRFMRRSLDNPTEQGFEAMNTALTSRAEAAAEHQG